MVPPICEGHGNSVKDGYALTGKGRERAIRCKYCNTYTIVKSNKAIIEEFERQANYLRDNQTFCSNHECDNYHYSVELHPKRYHSKGKGTSGNKRFTCKLCRKSITQRTKRCFQERLYGAQDKSVFSLLVNNTALNKIMLHTGLTPNALYKKIDFIHRQCVRFIAKREEDMSNKLPSPIAIAMDKQDYVVNWTDSHSKKNVQLTGITSVEAVSGYVLASSVNYDPAISTGEVIERAGEVGDLNTDSYFRTFAQYFIPSDVELAMSKEVSIFDKQQLGLHATLPSKGSQLHSEYVVFGHCMLLRHLVGEGSPLYFYLDGDSMLSNGVMSTFKNSILAGTTHALTCGFAKGMAHDAKKSLRAESILMLRKFAAQCGLKYKDNPKLIEFLFTKSLLEEHFASFGKLFKTTFKNKIHKINEPYRNAKALTRVDHHLNINELAGLYNAASVERLDSYFQSIRRNLPLLGRPFATQSNEGRLWHGMAPYNPKIIQKVLDIYRVYNNYVKLTRSRKGGFNNDTPAMRLGLARGLVKMEDILYQS